MTHADAPAKPLEVRLFGGFRQFIQAGTLAVDATEVQTVSDLRRQLERALGNDDNALMLLKASAFATDRRVLEDEAEPVPEGESLSLLPPVCGG